MGLLPTLVMTTAEGQMGLDAAHVMDICHRVDYLINPTELPAPYVGKITYKGKELPVRRADNSQTLFTYENTTSRLKRRTDPKLQYRDTAYFKDNTIQQISYPNASPATPSVSFTYDTVYKRIATMVDGTGTTAYTARV